MFKTRKLLVLSALMVATALTSHAGERRFTYTYETTTAAKGTIEIENWVTWKHNSLTGKSDSDVFQFRHELEYGITDRLQLGVYVFDWQYDRQDDEGHKARYLSSGAELIWNMTNPTTDLLGSALYGEIKIGEDLLELEGKLLLQKNFGPFTLAYNAILEAEWEGEDLEETSGELAQAVGVSYDLNKQFSVGAELLHEIGLPEWSDTNASAVFLGPNASFRVGHFYVTATALFQVTNLSGEPDAQIRLITGFTF